MKELNMKKILKGLIRFYQLVISPYLGNNCRFYPTCSNYAIEAIDRYGPIKGTKMMLVRIIRCNPWGGSGIDLVGDKHVKNKK